MNTDIHAHFHGRSSQESDTPDIEHRLQIRLNDIPGIGTIRIDFSPNFRKNEVMSVSHRACQAYSMSIQSTIHSNHTLAVEDLYIVCTAIVITADRLGCRNLVAVATCA